MSDVVDGQDGEASAVKSVSREVFISMLLDQNKNFPVVSYKDATGPLKESMEAFLAQLDAVHQVTPEEVELNKNFADFNQKLHEEKAAHQKRMEEVEQKQGISLTFTQKAYAGMATESVHHAMYKTYQRLQGISSEKTQQREALVNSCGMMAERKLVGLEDVFFNQTRPLYHYSLPATGEIVPKEVGEQLQKMWLKETERSRENPPTINHRVWNDMLKVVGYDPEPREGFTPKTYKDVFGPNGLLQDPVIHKSSLGEYIYGPNIGEVGKNDLRINLTKPVELSDPEYFSQMSQERQDAARKSIGDDRYDRFLDPVGLLKSRANALAEAADWLGMRDEIDRRFKEQYIPAAEESQNPVYLDSVVRAQDFIVKKMDLLELQRLRAFAAGGQLAEFLGYRFTVEEKNPSIGIQPAPSRAGNSYSLSPRPSPLR